MPLYTYECPKGHQFDRILSLKNYKQPQTCECGLEAKRKIMPTMVNCDMQPWDRYISPATGKVITSYKERRRDMEESGCVDYEPSMVKHQTKHMEDEDAKLEKAMDETVEKEIMAMSTKKREQLAAELSSGADCEYTRMTPT